MGSIAAAAVHVRAPRSIARLLGAVPAALLLSGLFTVWAGPLAAPAAATTTVGGVVGWGAGSGQITVPTAARSGITAIAADVYHSLALKSDGTVVGWGANASGQSTVPTGLSGVTAIAAGGDHSLALKSDGTVVAWGNNSYGQTSVPPALTNAETAHVTAIAAGVLHSLALKSDGTVVAWGFDFYGQTDVPAALTSASTAHVTAIAAGGGTSLALKSDGTVVGWGANGGEGQATVPAGLSGVTAIAAGDYHSLALKSDGTVVGWGRNVEGQTTVPAGLSGVTAIAGGDYHSLALKSDGTVVGWGDNLHGEATAPAGLSGVLAIAAGESFSLALEGVRRRHFAVAIVSHSVAGAAPSVTVTALDADGNVATGYTGTIHFTSSDAQAVLPADYTFTAADKGSHKFTGALTLKTAGARSVTVTDIAHSSIKGSHTVTVTPAAAKTFTVSASTNPTVAGAKHSVTVKAHDAYGNVATGYAGRVHFTSSDTQAVLPADYTFTSGDSGAHTFTAGLTLKTAGAKKVTATDTAHSSITGVQTVTVTPGAAKTLSVSIAASPYPVGTAHSVTVKALDTYGNVATGYVGTIHFTSSDGSAVLPGDYTFLVGDNGAHKFTTALTLNTIGSQSVAATDKSHSSITGSQTVSVE